MRDQDVAERFAKAMNDWAAGGAAVRAVGSAGGIIHAYPLNAHKR